MIEDYPKRHVRWSMLKDPVGVGLSEVLEATVQRVRTTKTRNETVDEINTIEPIPYGTWIYSSLSRALQTNR